MTDIKLEIGATGPISPQAAGFSTTPASVYQGTTTAAGFTMGTGGDPSMAAIEGGNEMAKSVVGGGMGTITCAADMMIPRSVSSGGEEAGPRIHKELNEILGKKQQELHVQIPPPPLLKGPAGGGGPSPAMVNGAKLLTPQANGMVKPSPTSSGRGAAAAPQSRTGTRGATARASGGNVSKSIEDACQAAAIEDGVLTPGSQRVVEPPAKASKAKNGLRRGKWTPEEESYANRLIVEFKAGLLPLTDGTTLRTFLSKLLNCDPMRISKKFVGQNCIGKQVFRRRQVDMDRLTNDDIERSRQELAELERKFLERVAQTNRCKNTSGIAKLPGGKDSGVGQVAPEISRRQQEYMGVGGRSVTGPVVSPWMLPPTSGSSAGGNTGTSDAPPPSSSLLNWDHDGRPPQHAGRTQGGGGGVMTRRSSTSGGATAAGSSSTNAVLSVGMPRSDSADSLFQAAENITPLSDYPRNSSIGDLASLGIFSGSPFQSTDNLVGLAATTSASSPASAASGSASYSSGSTAPPPAPQPSEWMPAPPPPADFAASNTHQQQQQQQQPSSAPYFESSGAALPPPGPPPQQASRSSAEGAMTRLQSNNRALPRVESSTGLTSLRVQGGMPRHGSVEDFLSLVACGDIPAPESNILSNSIFSGTASNQRGAAAAQAARAASAAAASAAATASGGAGAPGNYSNFPPPAVISFAGIGKSSGVPQGFPGQSPQPPTTSMMEIGGGSGKRARQQAVDGGVDAGVDRTSKQPKMEAGGGRMYDQY